MAFGGDLSFGLAANLEMKIERLLAGNEHDRIAIAGGPYSLARSTS